MTVLSIVSNLSSTRTDIEIQRPWISVAQSVLETYAMEVDVSPLDVYVGWNLTNASHQGDSTGP